MQKIVLVAASVLFLSRVVLADEPTLQGVSTRTGNEIGLALANYTYTESSDAVQLSGNLYGVEYERTQAFGDFFIRGDFLYKRGTLSYSSQSSGSLSNLSNYYYETRALIGKDFPWPSGNWSPFLGIGYRYLYDDNRGVSSSGAAGYQREISYLYIPLGAIYRSALTDAMLETRVEYDYLLKGKVNSHLSDTVGVNGNGITSYSDTTNQQASGWGLKVSTSYQRLQWSLTPYMSYWMIQNSDMAYTTKILGGSTFSSGVFEPTNRTLEFGLKGSYKF